MITAQEVEHKLVSIKTIASYLELSPAHVRDRLVKRQGFPTPYMIGGARRWDLAEIVEWVESKC